VWRAVGPLLTVFIAFLMAVLVAISPWIGSRLWLLVTVLVTQSEPLEIAQSILCRLRSPLAEGHSTLQSQLGLF
jgi:hypothetical protein